MLIIIASTVKCLANKLTVKHHNVNNLYRYYCKYILLYLQVTHKICTIMLKNKSERVVLIKPKFDSELTDLILELEALRIRFISGSTLPFIFFQLKHIFHLLESIGSARIEGNNTTIAEYVDSKISATSIKSENIREIENMEDALEYIDELPKGFIVDRRLISELHTIIVKGLKSPPKGEGDKSPGVYRTENVTINGSKHTPPEYLLVNDFMEELVAFINQDNHPKYDLITAATAHHRFCWIHPFGNGNGRTVRALTYAILVRYGFTTDVKRIINPTAIFCIDRNQYYHNLTKADLGTEEGMIEWITYVLSGFKNEIEKIDKLLDYEFLKNDVLIPAIKLSKKDELISEIEYKILIRATEKQLIQANDLHDILSGNSSSEISRRIRKLKERGLLQSLEDRGRKYYVEFGSNFLLRGVIEFLGKKGFLPLAE